ncbi:membrane-associating domain-containing protein [Phaeosphaeriaceae sp. PMI808]|nr:membrane-associating domain-containing protein [Phaeosphaeriaceae sp. PMI808]
MAISWVLPVRAVQALLALTVLGLMGYVSSWWSTHWRQSSPSEVNFLIFAPAWTLLALAPLIVVPLKFSSMLSSRGAQIGMLALEGLTMLHWFGGFIALAVFLSDRICFGTVCDVARASTAISGLNWLVWAVTFVFGVIQMVKGGNGGFSFGKSKGAEAKVEMHQGV